MITALSGFTGIAKHPPIQTRKLTPIYAYIQNMSVNLFSCIGLLKLAISWKTYKYKLTLFSNMLLCLSSFLFCHSHFLFLVFAKIAITFGIINLWGDFILINRPPRCYPVAEFFLGWRFRESGIRWGGGCIIG